MDDQHFLDISTIKVHIGKYFDQYLYTTTMNTLNKCAENSNDKQGKNNYINIFLRVLEKNIRYIDERLSNDKINSISERTNKVQSNNVNLTLPTAPAPGQPAIPDSPKVAPKLPKSVCKKCLRCDLTAKDPKHCRDKAKYICTASKLNWLICSQCERHKENQK